MILAYFSTIFLVILGMVYCSFYHIARVRDSFGFFNEARTTDHKRRTWLEDVELENCSKAEFDTWWWPPMLRCPYQSSLHHGLRPPVSRGANSDCPRVGRWSVPTLDSFPDFPYSFPYHVAEFWPFEFWTWFWVLRLQSLNLILNQCHDWWFLLVTSVYCDVVMENTMFCCGSNPPFFEFNTTSTTRCPVRTEDRRRHPAGMLELWTLGFHNALAVLQEVEPSELAPLTHHEMWVEW